MDWEVPKVNMTTIGKFSVRVRGSLSGQYDEDWEIQRAGERKFKWSI
jgi:hypothetical protein